MSSFNTNTSHPLIKKPEEKDLTSIEYFTWQNNPYVTSDNNNTHISVNLDSTYRNVRKLKLYSSKMPQTNSIPNIASSLFNNIITFKILDVINPTGGSYETSVYNALTGLIADGDNEFEVILPEISIDSPNMATLLTSLFNKVVNNRVINWLITYQPGNEVVVEDNGGYNLFSVVYDSATLRNYIFNYNSNFELTLTETLKKQAKCGTSEKILRSIFLPSLLGYINNNNTTSSTISNEYVLSLVPNNTNTTNQEVYGLIGGSKSQIKYTEDLYVQLKNYNFIDFMTSNTKNLRYFAHVPLENIDSVNFIENDGSDPKFKDNDFDVINSLKISIFNKYGLFIPIEELDFSLTFQVTY